jgi:hypothetical protein
LLPSGERRTVILEEILGAVRQHAQAGDFTAAEVAGLSQLDGETRTIALAAMQGDDDLIDDDAVIHSINRSESGMEQYHAIRLAYEAWDNLSPETRRRVLKAIRADAGGAAIHSGRFWARRSGQADQRASFCRRRVTLICLWFSLDCYDVVKVSPLAGDNTMCDYSSRQSYCNNAGPVLDA